MYSAICKLATASTAEQHIMPHTYAVQNSATHCGMHASVTILWPDGCLPARPEMCARPRCVPFLAHWQGGRRGHIHSLRQGENRGSDLHHQGYIGMDVTRYCMIVTVVRAVFVSVNPHEACWHE